MFVTLGEVCERGASNLAQKDIVNLDGEYPIFGASGYIGNVDFYHQEKSYLAVVKDGAGVGRVMLLPAKSSVIGTMQYLIPKENFVVRYLYYAIKAMHLEKYYMGAAIPHIYFKDYKNEKLKLRSIKEQNHIVDVLDNIEQILYKHKQQLKKIDELIKARFVEMFGEPGKDEKGWGLTILGKCCELNPKKHRDIDDDVVVSFVPMSAVSKDGRMNCSEVRPYKDVKKGFTYFAEYDVLFAKITPCMENGKGAVAKGLSEGIGFGSTEFHVLRPIRGKSNPYWLYFVTSMEQFRIAAKKTMTGSGGQLRVPISFLDNYPISLPPIELQNQFEEFIHKSDKSKVVIEKSLKELETLQASLMQKYFS